MMRLSRSAARLRSRRGLSLVEVMIAVALLAAVAMSLAAITPKIASRGRDNDIRVRRALVVQQQVEWLLGQRWAAIDSGFITTGTTTLTSQGITFKRTISIPSKGVANSADTVWLIVTPQITNGGSLNNPDTTMLIRGRVIGNPLCTLATC